MAFFGGADGDRTHDLMNAIHALSQLSYSPVFSFDLLFNIEEEILSIDFAFYSLTLHLNFVG
jgi:hypothetical protein